MIVLRRNSVLMNDPMRSTTKSNVWRLISLRLRRTCAPVVTVVSVFRWTKYSSRRIAFFRLCLETAMKLIAKIRECNIEIRDANRIRYFQRTDDVHVASISDLSFLSATQKTTNCFTQVMRREEDLIRQIPSS